METVTRMIVSLFLMSCCIIGAYCDCTFPDALQNNNWTSSNFGLMQFANTTVQFSEDGITSWSCLLVDGDQYIIKSVENITQVGQTGHYFYCMELTMQNTYSFSYYLQSEEGTLGKRRKLFLSTEVVTMASKVCTDIQDVASYNVMIREDSPLSARQYCTTPLLGTFTYTAATVAAPSTELCANNAGMANVCGTSSRDILTFNYTACSTEIAFTSSGVLNCIASVTSGDIYYQTFYNNDTSPTTTFICMAVSHGNVTDGFTVVYASYMGTACVDGQNSTYTTTGGGYLTLNATETCPIVSASEDNDYTIIIIAVVIAGLILIAIVVAILLYCCWWKKRDPNAGKPIIENTKPRFIDPDKEDILEDLETDDARSAALTRDDVVIEANSPSFMANPKTMSMQNGLSVSPVESFGHPSKDANGSMRRDSGLGTGTDKSTIDRPTPRMAINPNKESMVIFDGDVKVMSGNDARVVPNTTQNARALKMSEHPMFGGTLSLQGLEDMEYGDDVGELSASGRYDYPSYPREKSNLFPPSETFEMDERTPR